MFEADDVDGDALYGDDEVDDDVDKLGASPPTRGAGTGTASLASSSLATEASVVPKSKPGAKWNRQRAIVQVSTAWNAAIVDLHGEVVKAISAQSEADGAAAKLLPEARGIFKDTSEFNQKLFKIFTFWNAEGAVQLDPADAKALSFKEVMNEKNEGKSATTL